MTILKFNGYEGSAELDLDHGLCRGRILFIDDLVTYASSTVAGLQKEFEAAVEDYIATCKSLGRQPQRPLEGQFNVRVSAELLENLNLRAADEGISLNDIVERACEAFVHRENMDVTAES